MFTVSVEVSGKLVAIRYGASHTNYRDQRDLARGLSAGIGREGVTPSELQTVEGPMIPDAVVLTDSYGFELARFVDTVDVSDEQVLLRHKDGLVFFPGN